MLWQQDGVGGVTSVQQCDVFLIVFCATMEHNKIISIRFQINRQLTVKLIHQTDQLKTGLEDMRYIC